MTSTRSWSGEEPALHSIISSDMHLQATRAMKHALTLTVPGNFSCPLDRLVAQEQQAVQPFHVILPATGVLTNNQYMPAFVKAISDGSCIESPAISGSHHGNC